MLQQNLSIQFSAQQQSLLLLLPAQLISLAGSGSVTSTSISVMSSSVNTMCQLLNCFPAISSTQAFCTLGPSFLILLLKG